MLRPGVSAVVRNADDEWRGPGSVAPERGPADVDGAEERARVRVVGPDLLLVRERRPGLPGDDDRRHPRVLIVPGRCGDVVGARDPDRLVPLEAGLVTSGPEVGRQVRVIEARAVRPGETAVAVRLWPERDSRVAVRDQAVLVVPRQRPDRPAGERLATRIRPGNPVAVAGAPAGVRRLRPVVAGIEREVHARDPDPLGERAGVVRAGVAVLEVDVLVCACDDDVRMVRIDCHRRLVLLVLRERRRIASGVDERVSTGCRSRQRRNRERNPGRERKGDEFRHALLLLSPMDVEDSISGVDLTRLAAFHVPISRRSRSSRPTSARPGSRLAPRR